MMSGNDESDTSHRFVAFPPAAGTGLTLKRISGYHLGYLAMVVTWIAGFVGYQALVSAFHWEIRGDVLLAWCFGEPVLFFLGFRALRWYRDRKILIRVTSDSLMVNQRKSDTCSFADVRLGLWGVGSLTVGTALHLQCGSHSLVLGGRDHRLATATRLDEPPVACPDAWMWASEFDHLLAAVARLSRLDIVRLAPDAPNRCLFFPSSESMPYTMWWAFGDKLPFKSAPQPTLAIDVGQDEIQVIDPSTGALMASAARAELNATAVTYENRLARVTLTTPALIMHVPGLPPITVECQEGSVSVGRNRPRFVWRGEDVQRTNDRPAYVVTSRDWLILVEMCGPTVSLTDRMQRPRRRPAVAMSARAQPAN